MKITRKTIWLTVPKAAEVTKLSASAIYGAIAQGRLPRKYKEGNLVVSEEAVRNWESTHRQRGRQKGYSASEEHKAKIAAAQKMRWAKRKQQDE
jgi:predicted DNA-binding transcriptional regulator AlpA